MYGLNINPTYPGGTPSLEELQALGVEMLRYTYYDSSGGDGLDQDRARHYRQKIQEYRQAGIGSLIILTYDTYPNKPSPDAPDHDWDNYIERFARRSGQIAQLLAPWQPAFQVWNEPDHPPRPDYSPTLREAVFGRMLRRTYQAIKSAAPRAPVITAGLASGDHRWLTRVIESLGGNLPADFIAFHPYGQRPDRDWPHARWFFNEGSYVGNLLNNYYRAGLNKPVWITEMGIKHEDLEHNQEKMAEFLRRYYRTIATRYQDKVQQLFWFCYSDNMVEPFGLLDRGMQRKPIYQAFREAAAERLSRPPQPAGVVAPPAPVVTTPPSPVIAPPSPVTTPPSPPVSVTPPVQPPPVVVQPGPPLPTSGNGSSHPLSPALADLASRTAALQAQIQQFQEQIAQLQEQLKGLSDQQAQLLQQLQAQPAITPVPIVTPSPAARPAPPIQNIIPQLKRHPSLPFFPSRSLDQIQRIIVHHTAIEPSIGAERIATYRVDKQNWPGIGYHYFISGDGQIQQTNELTTEAWHAGDYNAVSVGVCFAGDFTQAGPSPAQIEAGAQLIAWLLREFHLPFEAVSGYKELAQTQSPGVQWDAGVRWGDQLRERIRAYL